MSEPEDSGWVDADAPQDEPSPQDVAAARAGRGLLYADQLGTVAFVVTALPAAVSSDWAHYVLMPLSLALGAIGVVFFLWSYFIAVQRSRRDEIAVSQLYFVSSGVAPKAVRFTLLVMLTVQIVVGIGAMAIGFAGIGQDEANWSAFAIVVPLFGFGVNGMWVARHGTFQRRILAPRSSHVKATPAGENPEQQAEPERHGPEASRTEQDSPNG